MFVSLIELITVMYSLLWDYFFKLLFDIHWGGYPYGTYR